MTNPNSLHWLIYVVIFCWPSPATILLTVLATLAIRNGWIKIRIDTSKAPKLNWRRNA